MNEWKPYDYQKRVANKLLSGNSVILQAPTGAGKTTAALLPFLHAWRDETTEQFPAKCVYVVPMRVLAHQFVLEYERVAASIERRYHKTLHVRIQTGDQPDDRKFEGDLIFCTIDQFLSGYLTMPYGLPNRLANINAGVGVGSYLVFDEFHLLDPESTLPTAWHAIKQFSQIAPVLLMTATFSKSMLDALAKDLNAIVETVSRDEAIQIENRIPKPARRQRIWETASELLSSDAVIKAHKNRSLVLCNTVSTAQRIYRELEQKVEAEHLPVQLLLLHSRFLPEHRRAIEDKLRRFFGNGKDCDDQGSFIAIATQTIEVGVDITSEVLHTELAPASSLIQRAGRCARYPGEQGRVIVYPVEKYTPYATDKDGKIWKGEMIAAFQWLQNHSGETFDFEKEQELVNEVATPRDEKVLEGLFAGRSTKSEEIYRVQSGDQQSADGQLLIRDAESCRVLIHPDPNVLLENPRSANGFNLHPATLYGLLKEWQQRAEELDLPWIAKTLYDSGKDEQEENSSRYRWDRLSESLIPGARLIVVNPALAGYNPNEGFLPDRGNTLFVSSLPENATAQTWEGYSYKLEAYEEHIKRVLAAFDKVALPEFERPALLLEKIAKWPAGSMLEAAWLICLLHDTGKLSKAWQSWAHAHQQAVGNSISTSFAAAHTDTDNKNAALQAAAKEAARRNPKPHHAAEGAIAAAPILFKILPKELAQASLTAIARHHTPFADKYQPYSLATQSKQHISETLNYLPLGFRMKIAPQQLTMVQKENPTFASLLTRPSDVNAWLAYTLLVRALRRADQQGTSDGNN